MIEIRKFKSSDLLKIDLQEAQQNEAFLLTEKYGKHLEQQEDSYTALKGNEVLVCAGLYELWPGRGYMWGFFGKDCGKYMIRFYRFMKNLVEKNTKYFRIETTADKNFKASHRLISFLGFKEEGLMKHFWVDGSDHYLYARIKWQEQ